MSGRPRAGHNAGRKTRATPTAPADAPEQNPLDFALSFMRDDSKPDTLRVSVAKAAMPYLHKRGETDDEQEDAPEPNPMSDLELARRIAHILMRGKEQAERERAETATTRSDDEDAAASTAPHAPPANAGQPMPSAQVCTDQVGTDQVRRDDERAQHNGPPDPHPAYRWIP